MTEEKQKTDETATAYPFRLTENSSTKYRLVVLGPDVTIERHDGHDAMGAAKWSRVDISSTDYTSENEWLTAAVFAVLDGTGDTPDDDGGQS